MPRPGSISSLVFKTIIPFVLGAALVVVYVTQELRWWWPLSAVLAPIGGAVVVLLFRAGAMI